MTPPVNPTCLWSLMDIPPQAVNTTSRLPKPASSHSRKIQQGRSVGKGTTKATSAPHINKIMEYVEAAMRASDPEQVLAHRLHADQVEQQARFAALPTIALQDDWILLRHQQLLQENQATHDAAVRVTRLLKSMAATS